MKEEEEEEEQAEEEEEEEEEEGGEDQVMSEVHIGCPPRNSGPHVTHFTISTIPPERQGVILDEDGDLIVTRRNKLASHCFSVIIQHNITSSIPSVGLQVWKAELALSDFVLHIMSTSSEFDGAVAIELGAGTGLVGLLLARTAKTVFLTDHGYDILDNCAMNAGLNCDILSYKAAVHVRELNWMNSWPPTDNEEVSHPYAWTSSEVEEAENSSLLVAADVIYSDDLTDALFDTLKRLMSRGSQKVLYLALEKRYNFSVNDFDVVANGYSRFLSYVRNEEGRDIGDSESLSGFTGKRIDLTQVPQYVLQYDRGSDLEIWKISYNRGLGEP